MSKVKKYTKVVSDFEVSIFQMQKDLEYLAEHNSLSTLFFDKQNRILKALIDYYDRTQSYIQHLEQESLAYQKVKRKQFDNYEDRIVGFEAICVIHGILDFPMWLSKGKESLLYEAEELGKNRKMRLPLLFNEKLSEFSKEDQNTVMRILQRDLDSAIHELLNQINKKKINLKHGIRT